MYTDSTTAPEADGDTAGAGLSALAREFEQFVADIEELIQSTTALSAEDWGRAKAKLQARVAEARRSVDEIGSTLLDRASSTVKEVDAYVHERPWQAIGISAAVGLLAGYLFGRRE